MNLANAAGPPASSIARSNAASRSSFAIRQVKHYLSSRVKQCLIPRAPARAHNQAVLDAKELRRRLLAAMDEAQPRVTSAALAEACHVTPQAVNGWRKTGRLAKRHLAKIAQLTRRPLEYFLDDDPESSSSLGLRLRIEEAEAIKRLRDGNPDWRNYVLSLAMVDRREQDLLLNTMRQAVPDYKVERAYGRAPHTREKS